MSDKQLAISDKQLAIKKKKVTSKFAIRTCPHCLCEYIIGLYGTINGCDACEGIIRNPRDGSIVNMNIDEETFIKRIS